MGVIKFEIGEGSETLQWESKSPCVEIVLETINRRLLYLQKRIKILKRIKSEDRTKGIILKQAEYTGEIKSLEAMSIDCEEIRTQIQTKRIRRRISFLQQNVDLAMIRKVLGYIEILETINKYALFKKIISVSPIGQNEKLLQQIMLLADDIGANGAFNRSYEFWSMYVKNEHAEFMGMNCVDLGRILDILLEYRFVHHFKHELMRTNLKVCGNELESFESDTTDQTALLFRTYMMIAIVKIKLGSNVSQTKLHVASGAKLDDVTVAKFLNVGYE